MAEQLLTQHLRISKRRRLQPARNTNFRASVVNRLHVVVCDIKTATSDGERH